MVMPEDLGTELFLLKSVLGFFCPAAVVAAEAAATVAA
jgi:hypothetical protein